MKKVLRKVYAKISKIGEFLIWCQRILSLVKLFIPPNSSTRKQYTRFLFSSSPLENSNQEDVLKIKLADSTLTTHQPTLADAKAEKSSFVKRWVTIITNLFQYFYSFKKHFARPHQLKYLLLLSNITVRRSLWHLLSELQFLWL